MKKYKRYRASLGVYDGALYVVRRGKDRYPYSLPYRFVTDYSATPKLSNKRLEKLKRSRNWHEDIYRFRQRYGIPEKGLSPTKAEKWYSWLYSTYHHGDAKSYRSLLKQMEKDIDELVNKYRLGRVPFIQARLENYLLLSSRFHSYRCQCFVGYFDPDERDRDASLWLTPYIKLPYHVKTLLTDWLKNGVPQDIACSLEIKDHPLGKTWRLCCRLPD